MTRHPQNLPFAIRVQSPAMRMRTMVLVFCVAALFFVAAVAIVPGVVALAEPIRDPRASTCIRATDACDIQPVALAGDLTFRGPPVV